MSECKHEKFTKLEVVGCNECYKTNDEIELERERDELQAQVKDREREIEQIEVKCCACHAGHIAQVAVMRGALERARKGFVNLIDLKLLPSEEYEKDANKIAQHCFEALTDTPSEAAEHVQKLVAALEEVEKMGTYRNDGYASEDMLEEPWATVAANALASTPSEAAERVNGLVEALETIERTGTGTLDGVVVLTQEAKLARQALADWRREE